MHLSKLWCRIILGQQKTTSKVFETQKKDRVTKERLYFGNWEYDNDPTALCNYDAICDLFTNEFIAPAGESTGSADLAMKGRDRFIAGH